jgi:hypothetical protein
MARALSIAALAAERGKDFEGEAQAAMQRHRVVRNTELATVIPAGLPCDNRQPSADMPLGHETLPIRPNLRS